MNSDFLPRKAVSDELNASLKKNPVTALLGPRQAGKSTMARLFATSPDHQFDLESPIDLARLDPDAYGLLASLTGVVVIDEIQQLPQLFAHLRVIVDHPYCRTRFLVTGSASPALMSHTAETLAGRVRFIDMEGFHMGETGSRDWEMLWFRGGFPRSFLAETDQDARLWIQDFLKTYVMRDIQRLAGGGFSPQVLAKFLMMLAHYHGQFWNQKQVATSLSVDVKTVQKYIEVLEGAFLVRLLPPLEKNIGKRLRKSNKVYFRDSGLLHQLLRISNIEGLRNHDRIGASWEGFGIQQVLRVFKPGSEIGFWRTLAGSEVDLVFELEQGRVGFEFKCSTQPKVSRGTYESIKDLGLSCVYVIHPGETEFSISDKIKAVPLANLSVLAETTRSLG